jgi:hypothetical protein
MSDENEDFVTRQKRTHSKKSKWEKSDKVAHGKRTALKRRLAEIHDDDDEQDWRDLQSR